MSLSSNLKLPVRQGPLFGYPVAAGVHVYAGAMLMFNAAGMLQRVGDANGVAFAGIADRELDNSAGLQPNAFVVPQRATYVKLAVPGAVYANIGAAVYATDDATCTLSSNSGANPQIGNLAGFEGGATWVKVLT